MANHRRNSRNTNDQINPYIALSDLMISLVLVIIFFVALGKLNLVNIRYKRVMEAFEKKVQTLPEDRRPRWEHGRNDPPGVQRWVFDGRALFVPIVNDNDTSPPRLTPEGEQALSRFAQLLSEAKNDWTRIRVEGHTQPFFDDAPDRWDLSASRAAVVVRQIQIAGRIAPWFCAVAGRAGQNPLYKVILVSKENDPQGIQLRNDMNAAAVRYSYKSPDAPDALSARREINNQYSAFLIERDGSNQDTYYTTGDSQSKRDMLIRHFKQNERVEVLIEYTTKRQDDGQKTNK